jgi:hypothetical protein
MTDNIVIHLRTEDKSRYNGSISLRGKNNVPTSAQSGLDEVIIDPDLAKFSLEVASAWDKYLVATTGVDSAPLTIDTKTRRPLEERAPYERFNDFFDVTFEASDELFQLTPSKVTPEVRTIIFQNWVNKVSPAYGITPPQIEWDENPWALFDPMTTVRLNSTQPYIIALFEAYRRTLQANGKAINIVTGGQDVASESEFEDEDYIPEGTCGESSCGATDQDGNYCSVCGHDLGEDDHNFTTPPSDEELKQRGLDYDAKAWAQSLYYQVRPKLFAKMVVSYKLMGGRVDELTPELREIGERARDEA